MSAKKAPAKKAAVPTTLEDLGTEAKAIVVDASKMAEARSTLTDKDWKKACQLLERRMMGLNAKSHAAGIALVGRIYAEMVGDAWSYYLVTEETESLLTVGFIPLLDSLQIRWIRSMGSRIPRRVVKDSLLIP